jgi:hypothetical protein
MPFGYATEDWINSELGSMKEETSMFGFDPSLPAMEGVFPVEADLESSNKAMDAAFDFESAASSPSALKTDSTAQPKIQKRLKSQMRGTSHSNSRPSASPVCTQTLIHLVPLLIPLAAISSFGLSFHSGQDAQSK